MSGSHRVTPPRRARSALLAMVLVLLCGPATVAEAQLTLRLTSVPADTPPDATIYIAGNFNGWNPGAPGFALARATTGEYSITLPAAVRGSIEYKFTLGSWDDVEISATGADIPNREFTIPPQGSVSLDVSVAAWSTGPRVRASTRTASVRILSDSFDIPQLGRTRRVWLYLPPDYHTSGKRYPVLYMHDGQNVFDDSTSFAGEWGVDETLDALHAAGDRGVIVVAIDHGAERRFHEYNPWVSSDTAIGGGEGDAYIDFLIGTLKPHVDRHYRTLAGPQHTGIMGSSMGGLISLYAALRNPEVFGRAGVFSCACWVARPQIYALAATRPPQPLPRLYFIAGALETPNGEMVRDQREMIDTLVAAGFPLGVSLRAEEAEDGRHSEWFWRREFAEAYAWLFRAPPLRKDGRRE